MTGDDRGDGPAPADRNVSPTPEVAANAVCDLGHMKRILRR